AEDPAPGICAATFSLLTRSVYHCALACHSGLSTSSLPSAFTADLPDELSTHGSSMPMSLPAKNPYFGGLVTRLARARAPRSRPPQRPRPSAAWSAPGRGP